VDRPAENKNYCGHGNAGHAALGLDGDVEAERFELADDVGLSGNGIYRDRGTFLTATANDPPEHGANVRVFRSGQFRSAIPVSR
jgi:hypothetical protein